MLNLSARTRNSQLTDEVSKSRTLKELLEYREKITNFCEFAPLPLYDKKYPIADGDAFAVDFILAQDTSKTMLGIQQDTAVSGQLTFERSSYQMFPVIESLETERVDADTRATKDVEVVSLVRHFEDPGELIAEDADKIAVTIVETNTAFLLTLQSATELRGSEEGDLVECANERYRSLKEQNRMLISAETQTHTVRKTTEGVLTDAIGTKDEEQHVTIWKIYDAYASDAASAPEKETSATTHPAVLGSWDALPSLEVPFTTPEEQFQRIVRTKGFQTALTRMEHVLAMNVFSQQQEQFKRGQRRELSVMYNYRLQLLWTFRTREQKGRTVTCMSWNPVNDNLLAVGYGKFYYTERITGMVCCWSAMNPINPQRSYKFQTPVTALNFSTSHPNLLAVGLYDGTVLVLDVAAPDDSVRSHSTRETSPSYQPIWHVQWLEDESSTYAKILAGCGDGRVCEYAMAGANLICVERMRVQRMEGKVKGIEHPRPCQPLDIPVFRHAAALVLTRHPGDPRVYLVGTDEGSVHRCSLSDHHQSLGVFLAHLGPVYSLQFSPFDGKLLLSCGADARLRVWGEGCSEPVLALSACNEPVLLATRRGRRGAPATRRSWPPSTPATCTCGTSSDAPAAPCPRRRRPTRPPTRRWRSARRGLTWWWGTARATSACTPSPTCPRRPSGRPGRCGAPCARRS
ncbi:dynein axonemal intermediate chain 4-like isoform X3 [Bacillus rossius redtenbacheri]|uniref:dynein axonemal intermediate chain 4-like isoform X3 n=1 Tax=Bacillus rossius redtenbacheri TaxID=93214 RepID=UPI002FDD82EF